MQNIKLYRHALSGHSHRAELALSLMGIRAALVDVDLAAGEHKRAGFLAKNPLGQVPVLEDGDLVIADSNAILVYLANRYDTNGQWYPDDPRDAAAVQRILSLAAGPLASGPAAARLVNVFGASLDHGHAIDAAHRLLTVLDEHLASRSWFVGHRPTIADIAMYSYIAHAPEGDVDLNGYPNILGWLARMRSLPGFVPMQASAVGLAA